jgi:hypothetical protein
MNKLLRLSLALLLPLGLQAQTNIALVGTANHSGGGVISTGYGPNNYNDGFIGSTPATLPWGWVNTSGWIEYTWTTAQVGINKVKFWKSDRPFTTCTIQYWNGSSYVTVATYNTLGSNAVDSFMFTSPITTDKLRFDVVSGSSNPNFREIEVFAGNPCPGMAASTLNVTSITSMSANISWGSVSGSAGYDYLVDTNPNAPFPNSPTTVSGTSASVTGLNPATTYYLHVRNRCNATDFSGWVDKMFVTYPPCSPPNNFHTTNLQPTSTNINWDPWPLGIKYDYVVDQTPTAPTVSTGTLTTTNTTEFVPGLIENTKYYVHIRTHCSTNEVSNWGLDSFVTPIPCRAPAITIENISTDEAIAYWASVPTSLYYEYAVTTSSTPPTLGTKYNYTSLHTSALQDGKEYFVHVRCECESVGIKSWSPWGTASFKTFAVGINNTNANGFKIKAYPNPVHDLITVDVNQQDGDGSITLTDLAGKTVLSAIAHKGANFVNVSGLAAGTYLLTYTDNTNKHIIKINKQ